MASHVLGWGEWSGGHSDMVGRRKAGQSCGDTQATGRGGMDRHKIGADPRSPLDQNQINPNN